MSEVTGIMIFILIIAFVGVAIVAELLLWAVWKFIKEELDVK